MINSDNKWWSKLRLSGLPDKESLSAESFFVPFIDFALNNELAIYKHTFSGKPRESFVKSYKELEALVQQTGLRLLVQDNMLVVNDNVSNGTKVFISDSSCLYVSVSRPNSNEDDWMPRQLRKKQQQSKDPDSNYSLYIEVMSFNQELSEAFAKLRAQLSASKVEASHVYLAVQRNGQTYFDSIGFGGAPLNEANYAPDVVEKYRSIVEDFNTDEPAGRLTIIDGPPGTGKSYLIRALVNECKHCMFIFIPSEMIGSLAGPVLGATILDYKEEGRPIVLICEDADECLTKRDRGNMGSLSTLLNVSAGTLGDIIDIRVVCTTNTEFAELDEAAKRDSRLLERIEVGEISSDQAQEIYKNLTGGQSSDKISSKEKYTLAKIYALAKKGKLHEKEKKEAKRKVGF